MNSKLVPTLALLGLSLCPAFAGEAPAPAPTTPAPAPAAGNNNEERERDRRRTIRDAAGRDAAGRDGQAAGGREGFRDNFRGAAGATVVGGMGGRNNLFSMASRTMGIEIEDPKAGPKLEVLPLGVDKRLVLHVPVGGVDNPSGTGAGWKMESIFKLTEEQTKAVDTLREEYKAEQATLNKEIQEQQKALAEKVAQLRLKYEQRANDVLTGEDKAAKEKLDALARETQTKNAQIVAEALPLYDANDMAQGFAMIRTIREKSSANVKAAEEKLIELIPAHSRDRIKDVIKQQSEMRDQMSRWAAGGRGGPGGDNRGDRENVRRRDEPVKPPAPPQAAEKKDF